MHTPDLWPGGGGGNAPSSSSFPITLSTQSHPNPTDIEYDVIIVGGGVAGIGAALGAKQAGANVLLVESQGCLGGAMTMRNVASFCGLFTCVEPIRRVIGGVWTILERKLLDHEAMYELPYRHRGVFQAVDPEKVKLALDELCEEAGVDVLLHATVVEVTHNHKSIEGIHVQQRTDKLILRGKAFVDASGDGDLSVLAGATVVYGHDDEVQLGSLATRISGFSSTARPTSRSWSSAIVAAKVNDPALSSYLHKNSSVLIPIPYTQDYVTFLASASYDARNAASISRAERDGRKQAQMYLRVLRRLSGHDKVYISQSGPHFGTRECIQPACQYTLTISDVKRGAEFPDSIGLAGWSMEYHSSKDPNWASSFVPVGGTDGIFDVPLRSLLSVDISNLAVAGRLIGADKEASASTRVMGTGLATGQAAGVYTALLAQGLSSSAVNVQEELLRQGAMIARKQAGPTIVPLQLPFQ